LLSNWEKLRNIGVLGALTDEALQALAPKLDWRRVTAGELVLSHLSRERDVYFVIEGSFRVSIASPAGRELSFRVLEAGAHFGEIAALTGAPRTASVSAQREGLIARCGPALFHEAFAREPTLALAVASHLARTVLDLSDRMLMTTLDARVRIQAELLRLTSRGERTPNGVVISPAPPHHAIAAVAGTQREVVTRELGALEMAGILQRQRRQILVLDPSRLRRLVEEHAGVMASHSLDEIP
jgi:CRP/FNR family transcriptional regulator, cyclic AMP receptor protein